MGGIIRIKDRVVSQCADVLHPLFQLPGVQSQQELRRKMVLQLLSGRGAGERFYKLIDREACRLLLVHGFLDMLYLIPGSGCIARGFKERFILQDFGLLQGAFEVLQHLLLPGFIGMQL